MNLLELTVLISSTRDKMILLLAFRTLLMTWSWDLQTSHNTMCLFSSPSRKLRKEFLSEGSTCVKYYSLELKKKCAAMASQISYHYLIYNFDVSVIWRRDEYDPERASH
jgi:hypothetical protein